MILKQLQILIYFILTGFIIGILFDIFRILRKSFKTIDFITYIQDFIFWILTGLILIFSIFKFNNGELRSYVIIGIIFGLFIYMLTISKFILKFFVFIINFIKKIVKIPLKILFNFTKKYFFQPIKKFSSKINMKFLKIKIKKDKTSNKIW